MPSTKTSGPGGHEIYNFGRPFLGHHYYTLSLSDLYVFLPPSRKEDFIKKIIIHFHKIIYVATPKHQNPCPKEYEIYNFRRPFHGHHYYNYTKESGRIRWKNCMNRRFETFHVCLVNSCIGKIHSEDDSTFSYQTKYIHLWKQTWTIYT